MYDIGEILLVMNDMPRDNINSKPCLLRGFKLKVVANNSYSVSALLINGQDLFYGVYSITRNDVECGYVMTISQLRDNKLNQLGI